MTFLLNSFSQFVARIGIVFHKQILFLPSDKTDVYNRINM